MVVTIDVMLTAIMLLYV